MRFRVFKFKPENVSRRNALKWWSWRALLGIVGLWGLLLLFIPLMIYLLNPQGFDSAWITILKYWKKMRVWVEILKRGRRRLFLRARLRRLDQVMNFANVSQRNKNAPSGHFFKTHLSYIRLAGLR